MNLTVVTVMILLPMLAAYLAVVVALDCRYHPFTKAIIIPDDNHAPGDSDADTLVSDQGTHRDRIKTLAVGLLVALGMSLILFGMTHSDSLGPILDPIVKLFDRLGPSAVAVVVVMVTMVSLTQSILVAQIWFTWPRAILVSMALLVAVMSWVLFDNWITFNMVSLLICVASTVIFQQRMSFMKLFTILLVLAFVYDAIQVFVTGSMIEYAKDLRPVFGADPRQFSKPGLLVAPADLSQLTPEKYGMLGAGDVMVFGLLAIATARYSRRLGAQLPVVLAFAGFAVSMLASFTVNWLFDSPQPATIYIVPLTALPVIIYAKRHGSYDQLKIPFYEGVASRGF